MTPDTDSPIAICCAADDGYGVALATMVASVQAHLAPGRRIALYVFDEGLTAGTRQRALDSWDPARVHVHWLTTATDRVAHLPLWGTMTAATYDRLLLPERLPPALGKVLWLDCDVVVTADIARLWDLDLADRALLAVQDLVVPFVSSRHGVAAYRDLGLPPSMGYFNAGVMLVNLDVWRRQDLTARALDYLERHRDEVTFWDQEGLNAAAGGHWGELDPRWNHVAGLCGRAFFAAPHLDAAVYRQVVEDPWIVHFAGSFKPWRYHNANPSRALYFHYVDQTAWAGWRPAPTWRSRLMGLYERRLRDVFYPAEAWRIALLRRRGR
ncbi:MAG: glycosyltransferase family 8 protein [Vicinamibacteria bacterium]|nr:glycosyltransferase family 8 protein [Vicinamibacteria bacterium]